MKSIIARITHSQNIKDTLAIAKGLYRIAISKTPDFKDTTNIKSNQPNDSWMNDTKIIIPDPIQLKSDEPSKISNQVESSQRKSLAAGIQSANDTIAQVQMSEKNESVELQSYKYEKIESSVPSTRFQRFYEFGKLGKSLLEFSVEAFVAKNINKVDESYVYEKAAQKISQQLCKMRGAPLKLAQIMSIQEDQLIPKPIRLAFQKAREQAHVMPKQEVLKMLQESFGADWQSKFKSFNINPFASASIGQVHKAVSHENLELAVKIQYPGVERGITSDINNLKMLMKIPKIFPKGIFIQKLLQKTKEELKDECDYLLQMKKQSLYDQVLTQSLRTDRQRFKVPKIVQVLSSKHLLVSEYLTGVSMKTIEQDQRIPQFLKNQIGRLLMKLTFTQIFEMGIMQSDPNPANFTYNQKLNQLNLFDFGATHIYKEEFLNNYCDIIEASIAEDRQKIIQKSIEIGFLTKDQNKVMIENHVNSILVLGEPMRYQGEYNFGKQQITKKIYQSIPEMLKNRLKSPPQQIYSLHRKLSGSYLSCIRLKAKVNCNQIMQQIKRGYRVKNFIQNNLK